MTEYDRILACIICWWSMVLLERNPWVHSTFQNRVPQLVIGDTSNFRIMLKNSTFVTPPPPFTHLSKRTHLWRQITKYLFLPIIQSLEGCLGRYVVQETGEHKWLQGILTEHTIIMLKYHSSLYFGCSLTSVGGSTSVHSNGVLGFSHAVLEDQSQPEKWD